MSHHADAPIAMDWINRLQERLTITTAEATAVTAFAGLFMSGLLIQHIWQFRARVPDGYYAASDSVFESRTRSLDTVYGDTPVPVVDTTDSVEENATGRAPAVRMNLNSANTRQLQQLSGIGPVLAERIVTFRKRSGPFSAVDDLIHVSGIGPKTLDQIRRFIYVETGADEEP